MIKRYDNLKYILDISENKLNTLSDKILLSMLSFLVTQYFKPVCAYDKGLLYHKMQTINKHISPRVVLH